MVIKFLLWDGKDLFLKKNENVKYSLSQTVETDLYRPTTASSLKHITRTDTYIHPEGIRNYTYTNNTEN